MARPCRTLHRRRRDALPRPSGTLTNTVTAADVAGTIGERVGDGQPVHHVFTHEIEITSPETARGLGRAQPAPDQVLELGFGWRRVRGAAPPRRPPPRPNRGRASQSLPPRPLRRGLRAPLRSRRPRCSRRRARLRRRGGRRRRWNPASSNQPASRVRNQPSSVSTDWPTYSPATCSPRTQISPFLPAGTNESSSSRSSTSKVGSGRPTALRSFGPEGLAVVVGGQHAPGPGIAISWIARRRSRQSTGKSRPTGWKSPLSLGRSLARRYLDAEAF